MIDPIMNPALTMTEVDVVLRRWLRLAHEQNVPAPVRKTLVVCAEDLANALHIDLPAPSTVADLVSSEQLSGEHSG